MAKLEHRTAAKDYPDNGIKKGDKYYFAKIKTGPYSSKTIRSKEKPRRSQLTSSEYFAQLWDIEDDLAAMSSMEDAQDFAERLRELGSEQQEKFDNLPEGFQQGDTGQLLEERANACESAADEIETIISDWESEKQEWEDDKENEGEDFDDSDYVDQVKSVGIE